MLKKVRRISVTDQVFESLKNEIISGTYKPGNKLPPETELSKKMEVSRTSVKMALQKLCTLGLAESKVGDGTYVTHFKASDFFEQIKDFLVNGSTYTDLLSLRTHLEFTHMVMAVRNITEAEILELESLLKKMETSVENNDLERAAEFDYEFHYRICMATKNQHIKKVFLEYGRFTYASVHFSHWKGCIVEMHPEFVRSIHRKILKALKSRDVSLCVKINEEIFKNFVENDSLSQK